MKSLKIKNNFMTNLKLAGAITAIITPFKSAGSLDLISLKKLVRWQLNEGIHGIVVCGSTGEAATQTEAEYTQTIKCVVTEVAGAVPVIAGAGSNDTQQAIKLSEIAARQGVDALLQVTPYYNKPTPNGLVAHFKAIAEAVNLPIIIYNVPGRTGSNVLPATIVRIANEVPQVIGVKEASGSITQAGEIIKAAPAGFVVLSGDDALALPTMALGGQGCISVVSNEVPGDFAKLCQAALDGDFTEAKRLHFKLLDLMNINFIESNPLPVKAALALMGLIQENFRLPLVPMEEKNRPALIKVLKELNLI
jgi:4-hydroxy-tetrahydrodipicolinate synthase